MEAKKEFFPEDDKSKLMAEVSAQENPRLEMQQMGNTLVDLTDQITKQAVKFIKQFNKMFSYVYLDRFIFQEADYVEVAMREVNEITQIFATYEIELNKMKNVHLYQKPRRNGEDADQELQIRVVGEKYEDHRKRQI